MGWTYSLSDFETNNFKIGFDLFHPTLSLEPNASLEQGELDLVPAPVEIQFFSSEWVCGVVDARGAEMDSSLFYYVRNICGDDAQMCKCMLNNFSICSSDPEAALAI